MIERDDEKECCCIPIYFFYSDQRTGSATGTDHLPGSRRIPALRVTFHRHLTVEPKPGELSVAGLQLIKDWRYKAQTLPELAEFAPGGFYVKVKFGWVTYRDASGVLIPEADPIHAFSTARSNFYRTGLSYGKIQNPWPC